MGVRRAAINFHPAPPEYPGIGCVNFALYEEAPQYGVTCHYMSARVDTGAIVAVRRFPLLSTDSVATLLARAYDHQLVLFYEILTQVLEGEPLPMSEERWTRKPFRRTEFNALRRVSVSMDRGEIRRRIRATTYGAWKPMVEIEGFSFELQDGQDENGNG